MANLALKIVCALCLAALAVPAIAAEKSTLDGYDRAAVAEGWLDRAVAFWERQMR